MKIEIFKKKPNNNPKDFTIKDFNGIDEPENFHIISTHYDLTIDKKEEMDELLKDLSNTKYNKNLADFIFNFKRNEIKDFIQE